MVAAGGGARRPMHCAGGVREAAGVGVFAAGGRAGVAPWGMARSRRGRGGGGGGGSRRGAPVLAARHAERAGWAAARDQYGHAGGYGERARRLVAAERRGAALA